MLKKNSHSIHLRNLTLGKNSQEENSRAEVGKFALKENHCKLQIKKEELGTSEKFFITSQKKSFSLVGKLSSFSLLCGFWISFQQQFINLYTYLNARKTKLSSGKKNFSLHFICKLFLSLSFSLDKIRLI